MPFSLPISGDSPNLAGPHQNAIRLRLGLLVCDHVAPELRGISGDYEDMFRRLFAGRDEVDVVIYDVIGGELPGAPRECDAWLTTGSRHSVNDDAQWIRALEGFVRDVAAARVPFIGICFGHQLIAKAMGGSVVRSERGWGVGVKEVEVLPELGLGDSYRVLTSHQDQVETIPPGAEVLGWNEHCPVSMLRVGSKMLGIQGHPEFDPAYSRALMELRRGRVISEPIVEEGLASLEHAPDSGRLAEWIMGMINSDSDRSV
jgi:GMP synthase (glutamine-hydrolysing)